MYGVFSHFLRGIFKNTAERQNKLNILQHRRSAVWDKKSTKVDCNSPNNGILIVKGY